MRKMTVLAASIAACMGAEAQGQFDHGVATMFYINKPFGGVSQQQNLASYGVRMNYGAGLGALSHSRGSLVDLRMQRGAVQEVRLNGVPFAQRDQLTNELTIGGKDVPNSALLIGGALIGVGLSCATENWPCENERDAPPPPAEIL